MQFTPFFSFLFAVVIFSSCATHKTCGDTAQDKKFTQSLYTKRYKQSLAERDLLCNLAAQLKKDTTKAGDLYRSLDKNYNNLSKEHQGLINDFKNLENKLKDLGIQHDDLKSLYEALSKSSSEQLKKLGEELAQKQAALNEKALALAEKERRLKELENLVRERDEMLNKIFNTLRDALNSFPKDELTIVLKDGKIYVSMLDKLLFKSGSAAVEARGVEALKKIAPVLVSNPDLGIVVEGHTDNVPIKTAVFKDNWDLSTYRATSVLRIMLENNVEVHRLTASGKGQFTPLATNETPEGRALNRRTEIILSPKLDSLFKLLGEQ